jgi:hypothetical protein
MSEPVPIAIRTIDVADAGAIAHEPDVAIAEAVADVLASVVSATTEIIDDVARQRGIPDDASATRLLHAGTGLAIDAIRTVGAMLAAVERSAVSLAEDNALGRAVAAHGRSTWTREAQTQDDDARAALQALAEAVLDRLDLTALVVDHLDMEVIASLIDPDPIVARLDVDALIARVDVERLAGRVDVDALAARIDMRALIDRLDLAEIATAVIEELDLPELIREAAGDTASDEVRQLRLKSVEADRIVGSAVDRVLGRRREG